MQQLIIASRLWIDDWKLFGCDSLVSPNKDETGLGPPRDGGLMTKPYLDLHIVNMKYNSNIIFIVCR